MDSDHKHAECKPWNDVGADAKAGGEKYPCQDGPAGFGGTKTNPSKAGVGCDCQHDLPVVVRYAAEAELVQHYREKRHHAQREKRLYRGGLVLASGAPDIP